MAVAPRPDCRAAGHPASFDGAGRGRGPVCGAGLFLRIPSGLLERSMDPSRSRVNNGIYDTLDERWYDAQDDPVALLRAESATRTPWIESEIEKRFPRRATRVLDVGCGGGFLSNALATSGRAVTGVDSSH